ncbi:leucine--tRNA ligase [Candidatus Roizmanbacteria bacterium]|nr:leucine--tRNA ligase [Candidatus Roizmanbacteria bacterium]
MKPKYFPQQFESKWVDVWNKEKTYRAPDEGQGKKMMTMGMFPYPSGAGLHVGHVRIFTGTDVLARFFRMSGYRTMHPMGWDAFGLPAENAAIKEKKNPMDMVPLNIANFKRQMQMLGLSYDWDREFTTTDPKYYGITQWLFLQFFKLGLLYKKQIPVYFCPKCKTGIAEEEVLSNGTHERCGTAIERKELPQWIFRITTYADSLLEGLKDLDWPTGILEMQKNWIGKSEGAEVDFVLSQDTEFISSGELEHIESIQTSSFRNRTGISAHEIETNCAQPTVITVYTTRPDTLTGVTALVVAPEHWVAKSIVSKAIKVDQNIYERVSSYVEESIKKLDLARTDLNKEKTGVPTGLFVVHPITGEQIPVWIADYVLGNYGHGAVMVVPAHDERDYEFAKKHDIPVRPVITEKAISGRASEEEQERLDREGAYTGEGYVIPDPQIADFLHNTDLFQQPLTSEAYREQIVTEIENRGLGKEVNQYKLRDWIFSRQRYWGEPIPVVHCETCAKKGISWWDTEEGKAFLKAYHNISKVDESVSQSLKGIFPISESELPLELPYLKSYEPSGTGESPLSQVKEWVTATCPHCGGVATRETDTMPNWAGSCWYFLAYAFWDNEKQQFSFDEKKICEWLPADWYLGGAEHAVLHLLYSRFWMHVLNDMGIIAFREPFLRLRNVGMVLAEDHRKMSKSWGNVINPDDVVKEFGADALRIYEMFMAPFNQENAWSTTAVQGSYRFVLRVWNLFHSEKAIGEHEDKKLATRLYKAIHRVGRDISESKFNTAIPAMMEFINYWEASEGGLSKENAKKFLQILAPFAPFVTEELWREVLSEKTSIHISRWPEVELSMLEDEELQIPVQVNGKVRGTVTVSVEKSDQGSVVALALADETIVKHLSGNQPKKIIYVPKKILNMIG